MTAELDQRRRFLAAPSLSMVDADLQARYDMLPESWDKVAQQDVEVARKLLETSQRLETVDSTFCYVCRCIDFRHLFGGPASSLNLLSRARIPLGFLDSMKATKDCPFCCLVVSSFENIDQKDVFSGRPECLWEVTEPAVFCELDPHTLFDEHSTKPVLKYRKIFPTSNDEATSIGSLPKNLYYVESINLDKLAEGPVRESQFEEEAAFRAVGPTVDFDLLKQFLNATRTKTGAQDTNITSSVFNDLRDPGKRDKASITEDSNPLRNLPLKFRLINIERGCLVEAPVNAKYVALSYVWGQQSRMSLQCTRDNCAQLYRDGSIRFEDDLCPQNGSRCDVGGGPAWPEVSLGRFSMHCSR